jgi:Tfp pilus assembly protein PilO
MTQREKVMFIILGIVAFIATYFNFVFKPQTELITQNLSKLDEYKQIYSMNMIYKQKTAKMEDEIKNLSNEFKKVRLEFPPVEKYDSIVLYIRDICAKSGFNIYSMNFSKPEVVTDEANSSTSTSTEASSKNGTQDAIQNYISNAELAKKLQEYEIMNVTGTAIDQNMLLKEYKEIPDGSAYSIKVKIFGAGTYQNIKDFIQASSEILIKTNVKDLSIMSAQTGTNLTASMTLVFYGIYDRSAISRDELNIIEKPRNKLFENSGLLSQAPSSSPDSTTTKVLNDTSIESINNYDFLLSAMAYSQQIGPPAATLTARYISEKEKSSKPATIFADEKLATKININVNSIMGKYYYEVITGNSRFPQKGTIEFNPLGDKIQMMIICVPRNENDNSFVDVSVNNTTDKPFSIKVLYDDQNKPRVKISFSGDVRVENN